MKITKWLLAVLLFAAFTDVAIFTPSNAQSVASSNSLRAAVMYGDLSRVQELISAGADVNAKDSDRDGNTALMLAAALGRKEIVQTLIAAKADVNAKQENGRTALMYAAIEGQTDTVRALIAAKADVNVKNYVSGAATTPCA